MNAEHPVHVERVQLAPDYDIARIINGGWQLSHGHHPKASHRTQVLDGLLRLVEAGFTTFDGADIYGGVESLFGDLQRHLRQASVTVPIQIHTKCVPDLDDLPHLRRRDVEAIVERSLRRLGVERLDLVQFHWWDYDIPGLVETAGWLDDLRKEGKIRHLGVTNVDAERLRQLLDAGLPILCNQIQYSLLDRRPARAMAELCRERGVHLLCYGSLAGGFLAQAYRGRQEIPLETAAHLGNRSLTKYRLIIEKFGGWLLFQDLLAAMEHTATRHRAALANVAVRWVLDQPAVAAAIVGTRTGAHLESNQRVFGLRLEDDDRRSLRDVLARSQGPKGPVFGLERIGGGAHQRLMKTGLNKEGRP